MAVAYRAASDGQNSSVTTHTCPIPTGTASGDVLIMGVNNFMNGSPINTPSGWTLVYNHGATSGGAASRNFALYTRVADGTEGSTLTLTSPIAAYTHIQILAYSGGTGVDATADTPGGVITNNNSPQFNSVTTTVAGDVVVGVLLTVAASGDTLTPPSGWTLRHTSSFFSTLNTKNYAADLPMPTAGASGGSAIGSITSGTTAFWCAFTVAVKAPAAAVTPVADFTGTPTSGTAPLSVTFTDTSTNTPTSWAWDFGDAGTSSSQNPTHSYSTSGVYTVTLIATNSAGSNTKTRTGYITVSEAIVYASGGGIDIW